MNRGELKEKAKNSLKGKYEETIIMLLIYFSISLAVCIIIGIVFGRFDESIVNIISNIVSIFISGLFGFGYLSYFLKISRNEDVTTEELFSKKHLWITYIVIAIITYIFTFLWSLLFIIPGIIAAFSYSQAYLIALDNPELGAMDTIKKSKEMMKSHKMDYFVLQLSFLGWIILGIFTFGILYFWLIPYIAVTNANFYNSLKENK